ncbi:MAG: HNH endonuclease signature motif containing protein, partial [Formivibrio sp.]|nr:HNH endonuclease signature motif containing protein [Formivibrio sp.]
MSGYRDIGEPHLARGGVVNRFDENDEAVREQRSASRGRSRQHRADRVERVGDVVARQSQRDREELGASGIRVHPVEENGKVQRRNVRLVVRGIVDVYKGGRVEERTEIEEEEYVIIHFKTERQLRDGIRHQMTRLIEKVSELDSDSPNKKFYATYKVAQDGYSDEEMREVARRPDQIRMYRAAPIDNRMLKGVSANKLDPEDDDQFNCVVEYLYSTYHSKRLIASLSREAVVELLSEGNMDLEDARQCGWTYLDVQRFCDRYRISHYVLDGFRRLVHKKVYNSSNYPMLMYVLEDCHMYPITDPAIRKSIQQSCAEGNHRHTGVLQQADEKKREEAEKKMAKLFAEAKWREDVTDIKKLLSYENTVVFYHKLHLKELLMELYKHTGTLYEFRHTSKLVTSIQLDNNVHLFANANHKAGCDWNTSKKVAELLNIPFRNQSLAGLSHEFFVRRYHSKGKKQLRVNIAQSKKEKILAEQCYQCNACAFAVEKGQWECDHIVPISCGGDAIARSNLQILCSACHVEKSRKEAAELVGNIDNSSSYYNDQTLKIFGQRPILGVAHNFMKPEEYTKDVKAGRKILAGLDNNKCYTNLLLTNKHEWNSFSVLNDATPF